MAHNITERDSVISVRDAGWHGLATVLDDYVTPEDARQQAFPWEPIEAPLYRAVPVVTENGPETRYEVVPEVKAIERSDDGGFLGAVGKDYTPVTNKEITEIAEAVEGLAAGEVRVETAGSLKGGRKVWMLLRLDEPIAVKGDPHGETIPYFGIQDSKDGTGSLRGQALFTRIICDNTSQGADLEAAGRGTEFTFSHTAGIKDRIDEAKGAIAMWRESVEKWNLMMNDLIGIRLTEYQRNLFVEQFIPMPVSKTLVSDRVVNNVDKAREEFWGIVNGITTEGIDLTAYGMVQAAVEFQQHVKGVRGADDLARAESRFKRAYLDRDSMTTVAVNLAREVATA